MNAARPTSSPTGHRSRVAVCRSSHHPPFFIRLNWLVRLISIASLSFLPTLSASASTADGARPSFKAPTQELSPARLRLQVRQALTLAWRQLKHQPSCRQLFRNLDADGQKLLAQARVKRAEKTPHAHICGQRLGVLGTEVGGRTIGVCADDFQRLDRHHAAALMLHEVLHHAGMTESPHDPDALTSREITRLVKRACDL